MGRNFFIQPAAHSKRKVAKYSHRILSSQAADKIQAKKAHAAMSRMRLLSIKRKRRSDSDLHAFFSKLGIWENLCAFIEKPLLVILWRQVTEYQKRRAGCFGQGSAFFRT